MFEENIKISAELLTEMATKTKDELVTVSLFRKDLSEKAIQKRVIENAGLSPDICGNIVLSYEKQVKKLEEKYGVEFAHKTNKRTGLSPIDETFNKEYEKYHSARLQALAAERERQNNEFIEKYIGNKPRKILHAGKITGTLVIEATVDEIKRYALMDEITSIMLHKTVMIKSFSNSH